MTVNAAALRLTLCAHMEALWCVCSFWLLIVNIHFIFIYFWGKSSTTKTQTEYTLKANMQMWLSGISTKKRPTENATDW